MLPHGPPQVAQMPGHYGQPPRPPTPTHEYRQTQTIKNQVNLRCGCGVWAWAVNQTCAGPRVPPRLSPCCALLCKGFRRARKHALHCTCLSSACCVCRKKMLRLEPDAANPQLLNLQFAFDASAPCRCVGGGGGWAGLGWAGVSAAVLAGAAAAAAASNSVFTEHCVPVCAVMTHAMPQGDHLPVGHRGPWSGLPHRRCRG